jgi:hypothetical protein
MSYLSIHIQEKDANVDKIDTCIFIIYDSKEEKFYLYGKRNNNEYIPYKYNYHYNELDSLCYFLNLIINHEKSFLTIEYHNIFIPNEDLDIVDYPYLYNKISKSNEIVAFEKTKIDFDKFKYNLLKLYSTPLSR